jgi:type IX secretion system PorP/SprF family membrane protein
MKSLIIFFIFFAAVLPGWAQQSDELRFNYENQYLRNPAALTIWNTLDAGAYYQQNFSAITNPPVTMFAGLQYPIPYQNFSVGGALYAEQAGVLRHLNINISTSYKLLDIFNHADYLALGASANFSELGVKGNEIIVTQSGDPLVIDDLEKANGINLGFGIFYNSMRVLDERRPSPGFQIGISGMKAVPQNINLPSISFQEKFYLFGVVAARLPVMDGLVIRPMVEVQYENKVLINGIAHLQLVYNDAFLVGASFDKFNALGFQFGYSFNNISPGTSSYSVVVNTTIPLGQIDHFINNGIGIGFQYRLWDNQFSKF